MVSSANKFLDVEEHRAAIASHDPLMVIQTDSGPLGGEKITTYNFAGPHEREVAMAWLSSHTEQQFQDGQVKGKDLEQHLYGMEHAHLTGRLRSRVTSVFGGEGIVYSFDWRTDVITVWGAEAFARQAVGDDIGVAEARVLQTVGTQARKIDRAIRKGIKLAPEIEDEIREMGREAVPSIMGGVNEKLALASGQ